MMRIFRLSLILAGAALLGCDQPTEPVPGAPHDLLPAFEVVQNDIVPLSINVFIPCAVGGIGEFVLLEGTLHLMTALTLDANGGVHIVTHAQPQSVQGVGSISGDLYNGTGVTLNVLNAPGLPFETTFVNNFRIIGQGTGNNFLVHVDTHLTVNANGDVTASVNHGSVECR